MCGRKFSRQHSVGRYIVDFYCHEERLVVELDGEQHKEKEQMQYDNERTKYLESLNHKVIRFGNMEVLFDTDTVLKKIERCFGKQSSLTSPRLRLRSRTGLNPSPKLGEGLLNSSSLCTASVGKEGE